MEYNQGTPFVLFSTHEVGGDLPDLCLVLGVIHRVQLIRRHDVSRSENFPNLIVLKLAAVPHSNCPDAFAFNWSHEGESFVDPPEDSLSCLDNRDLIISVVQRVDQELVQINTLHDILRLLKEVHSCHEALSGGVHPLRKLEIGV